MITYKRSILKCCKFNSKLGRSLYILMWQTNLKDWYLQCWFWPECQGQWYKWWRESQDQRMSELSLSQISRVACLGSRPIGRCINLRRCNQSSCQIENCATLKIFYLPAQHHIHAHFSLIFIHFHPFHPLSSTFIHFYPLLSIFTHFHPLSSTLIHFNPLLSTFIQF